MKKVFLVSVVMLIGVAICFAGQPDPKETQVAQLRKEVYQKVKYPAAASENFVEGEVWVSFKVDENGKIIVQDSSSLEKNLENDLLKQMKKMKVSKELYNQEDVYLMKFKFELV